MLRKSDRAIEVTDNDLEEHYRGRGPILAKVRVLQDEGVEIEYVVYYKVSEDSVPSTGKLWMEDNKGRRLDRPVNKPDGWLLHVIYYRGVSVLEYYSRSKNMTSVESEGILLLNAGESHWVKGKPPKDDDNVIEAKVFSVDHYRDDLQVYANVQGDSILLFDPRLDQRIDKLANEKAEREAPESLEGF